MAVIKSIPRLYPIDGVKYNYVSRCGRIWTDHGGRLRERKYTTNKRHTRIVLLFHGKPKGRAVAQVVASVFIPRPRGNRLEVCHKNDVKRDNRVSNLYWGTHRQNMFDAWRNGCIKRDKKYSVRLIRRVRRALKMGFSGERIAAKFGLNKGYAIELKNPKIRPDALLPAA